MKLSQCTYGVLVFQEVSGDTNIGMVVGITNNAPYSDYDTRSESSRAVPLVKWSGDAQPTAIHHNNIDLYKG